MNQRQAILMTAHLEALGWMVFNETPEELIVSYNTDYKVWVKDFIYKGDVFISDIEEASNDFKKAYEFSQLAEKDVED